ncbi:hypothetical protein A3D77_03860 [Candidatus Gottesmanbacteria bacterium RIFCSPHIGHO2_02_FULL_39_11]|uniref:Uncharacterized protein n=1 Tax=Candidatus Gottesmanbacteria bacterium RIFCSPHIGHO2_02_FULL_39_11 TaxID=1798382 RepID=A0A1F5ZK28_9BACT|nr:MAG: hypothetical protein A3D77_03860 [Candidatus Gottesmanbacteria bacterium RIFCSPHIGHO2_02_FULL_39_11]
MSRTGKEIKCAFLAGLTGLTLFTGKPPEVHASEADIVSPDKVACTMWKYNERISRALRRIGASKKSTIWIYPPVDDFIIYNYSFKEASGLPPSRMLQPICKWDSLRDQPPKNSFSAMETALQHDNPREYARQKRNK